MFRIRKSIYLLVFILVMLPFWCVKPPQSPELAQPEITNHQVIIDITETDEIPTNEIILDEKEPQPSIEDKPIKIITDDYTQNPTERVILTEDELPVIRQHTNHYQNYGTQLSGFNPYVLKAVDYIQSTAMDGGGYSDGKDGTMKESPIGYPVSFFGYEIIDPVDTSSYCTGASFTALIEALNLIYKTTNLTLTDERLDGIRMQELNGERRRDYFRLWGYWNAPYGNYLSLVLYAGMGMEVHPSDAQPGDFMYYQRASGTGHMVVFLGWYQYSGKKYVVYWSSQKKTTGLGDQVYSLRKIDEVKFVRLTNPDGILNFEIDREVDTNVSGVTDYWE